MTASSTVPTRKTFKMDSRKQTLEDGDAQQRLDANILRRATLGLLDQHPQTK